MAGISGGLLGLTANVNKQAGADRDMMYMERMLQMKKQGEAEEQNAEAQYADVMASVQEQSNLLLENDRNAVQEHSNKLITQMKEKLKAVGGNKAAFMKAGGLTDLADYRANVLGSDAYVTGKNNNAYMQRILLLKEQGKGHLINERDMMAMNSYNANGGGKLSYTGVLNEIEVDDKLFEYGKNISPQEVLDAGNNRFKIMANYEADLGIQYNPDQGDKQLLEYIKYKGYGGMGSNTVLAKARMAANKAKKEKETVASPSVGTTITSVIGNVGVKSHGDMTFEAGFGKDKNSTRILGAKADQGISTTDRSILGLTDPERYKIKGGAQIASGKEVEFAQEFYGKDLLNEDGTITLNPLETNNAYDGKGSALTGKWKWTSWEGNYKPMGIVMGYKGKDKSGESMIIMDAVNKDGSPDTEKNAELYGDENPNGEPMMMIRMHDPDNPSYDWFQEVESQSVIHSHMLGQAFGDDNNVDDSMKEQQELQKALDKADVVAEAQIRANNEKMKPINNAIDTTTEKAVKHAEKSPTLNSDYFKLLTSQYNSGAMKRDVLIQSFYQAAAGGNEQTLVQDADSKAFTMALEQYELGELLSRNDFSDDNFISKFYEKDRNDDDDADAKIESYKFARTWKKIYDKNMNPEN